MTYFAEILSALIEQKNASQTQVAEMSGRSQSQVSRWVNGKTCLLTVDDIEAIAIGLCASELDHAELLAAHLRDLRRGRVQHLIEIKVGDKAEKRMGENAPFEHASPALQKAVNTILREAARNQPDFGRVLIQMARACESAARMRRDAEKRIREAGGSPPPSN